MRPDEESLRADGKKTATPRGKRRYSENRVWDAAVGSTRLTGRSSARQCWRKCHWPGYPSVAAGGRSRCPSYGAVARIRSALAQILHLPEWHQPACAACDGGPAKPGPKRVVGRRIRERIGVEDRLPPREAIPIITLRKNIEIERRADAVQIIRLRFRRRQVIGRAGHFRINGMVQRPGLSRRHNGCRQNTSRYQRRAVAASRRCSSS